MNKAFTRETDDEDDDGAETSPALPQGTRNYITPGGYERIKDELDQLLRVERPRIVEVVHWAASNGDRSENGDYIYGKRRLREIDRRIRFLTKRLDLAEVVDPATRQENCDQVFFGATVVLCDEQGEEQAQQEPEHLASQRVGRSVSEAQEWRVEGERGRFVAHGAFVGNGQEHGNGSGNTKVQREFRRRPPPPDKGERGGRQPHQLNLAVPVCKVASGCRVCA